MTLGETGVTKKAFGFLNVMEKRSEKVTSKL